MRKIFKYKLQMKLDTLVKLELPKGYKILNAVLQEDNIVVYALIDPEEIEMKHTYIYMIGTGLEIHDNIDFYRYLNTIQHAGLVYHVFVAKTEEEILKSFW